MRQDLVHQQRGTIGHTSRTTTGAESAFLTAGNLAQDKKRPPRTGRPCL
jgi:hypothetical protein